MTRRPRRRRAGSDMTTFYDEAQAVGPDAFAPGGLETGALDARSADLLFRGAHTTYAFTDRPVTDGELAAVYELLRFAPTAMNTQPLRITFVRSPEAKARLLPHLADGNRPKSASAPVVAILSADLDFHEHLPRLMPHLPGAKDRFADDAQREQAARFNATLQAGYFIIASRAAGLDAGPMGGFDKAGIDREFLAGTAQRCLLVVNLGHAAEGGTFPRSPRLDQDEVVTTL
ncbi:MAG: malonic semialdehyde reductase [Actinomycetota bacterium]|nr:malonic semialdehyde reductase [Actinomycetota bacterium]